jgi:alkylation response protein AidB-like acyl-CoA dehydrogenase
MTVRSEDVATIVQPFPDRDREAPEVYPHANVTDLQAAGVVAAPLPSGLGGSDWTLLDSVIATEEVATASPSTALLLAMPLGLAGVYAMDGDPIPTAHRDAWHEGQEWLSAQYLANRIFAACNSEKGAGGSLDATKATVRLDADGNFRISGEKILASFGQHADYFFSTAKVDPADLPGAGIVEFFFVPTGAPGVNILDDWDGFGMRPTESHTVRYDDAPAERLAGFPDFIATTQPLQYWYGLFAAIPLGCLRTLIRAIGDPAPSSPALRLRVSDAVMRYEALRAYLHETATAWSPAAGPGYAARMLRTKTFVTQESTKLCAELFALSGGRHYRRTSPVARSFADSFAGTALRPPLPLALDMLVDQFSLGAAEPSAAPVAPAM